MFFLLVVDLRAGVTVTGAYTDAPGQTLNQVHGYINTTTSVSITVTLSGSGWTDLSDNYFSIYIGHSENSTVENSAMIHDASNDAAYTNAGIEVGPFRTQGGGDGDNTGTFTIPIATLIGGSCNNSCDDYVDLRVFYDKNNSDADVTYSNSNASTYYAVDWEVGGVNKTSLSIDVVAPSFTSFTYPAQSQDFKDEKFIYNLAERLSDTQASQIRFSGDYGTDSGNNHTYTLSGTTEKSPNEQTVDVSDDVTLVDASRYDIQYLIYDVAGNVSNSGNWATAKHNATYDITAPTVTIIETDETTVTKIKDNTIDFVVKFDEDVTANNSVTVTLETGDTDGTATIAAWSSLTDEVSARYTVGTGHASNLLTISSIATNGNISDQAGNVMSGSGFDIDGGSNLSDIANITVDGVIPTVSSITTSSQSPGYYSTDEDVNITINFSEQVTLDQGSLVATLETGSTDRTVEIAFSDISNTLAASGTYTVQNGDLNTGGLSATLSISGGGTLHDGTSDFDGNPASSLAIGTTLAAGGYDLYVETTSPIVNTLTSTSADGSYGIGAQIPVVVSFINGVGGGSENVELSSGTIDITLETGDNDGSVSISSIADNSATASGNYTVAEDHTSSRLSATALAVNGDGATITDRYGNVAAALSIPDGANLHDAENIQIDGTRPTIASITSTTDAGTYGIGEQINLTVTFSEAVTLANGTLDLVLEVGTSDTTVKVTAFANSLTGQATYTVNPDDETALLTVSSDPAIGGGGTLKDVLDNNSNDMADFTIPNGQNISDFRTYVIDGVRPFISSIVSTSDDGTYGIGQTVDILVTFSEGVTLAGGNLLVDLETGDVDGQVTISRIPESPDPDDNALTVAGTYTVAAGHTTSALTTSQVTLSAGTLVDANNNSFINYDVIGDDIDVASTIVIDGIAPSAFTITSVSSDGGNAETGDASYDDIWNSTNTAAIVRVPVEDATLVNGTIQVQGKITGDFVNVADNTVGDGDTHTITSANATAGYADVTITAAVIEALDGFTDEQSIVFTAIITDGGNNSTTGSANSNEGLVIDETPLTVSSVSSSTNNGNYKLGDDINIRVTFDGDGTLSGGNLEVNHNASATNFELTTMSAASFSQGNYRVQAGDESAQLDVATLLLADGATILDVSGNPMTDFTIPADQSLVDSRAAIAVDGIVPEDFTVGSVTTVTENVVTGYWNASNTQIQVQVPVADDASLEGGTIQILGKTSATSFASLGAAHTILNSDLNSTVTITIEASATSDTDVEEINGFAEGETISISATITDNFGNATTGTTSSTSLLIDETAPSSHAIAELITNVSAGATNSVAIQGYWNIDTDYLKVSLGDISGKDDNIVNGNVLLYGNISSIGWKTLGIAKTISNGNQSDFFVEVGAYGEWGGDQVLGEPFGVEELGNETPSITLWDDMDGNDIDIKALVTDAAGNSTEYLHTNTFATTSNTTILIDGTDVTDRPTVSSATADKDDGWWGPSSNGLPIKIEIETSVAITVDVTDGTPTISLQTGSITGSAEYSEASGTTLSFDYTPTTGETSQGNSTNGVVDGRLEFKLDSNGEPIIALNNGIMYEASGNLLASATQSANPILPAPNTQNSLDGNKNIIIDGVAPYRVQNTLVDMSIASIQPDDDDNYWTERPGYYNSNTERMLFNFYYRYTADDANLDGFGSRVDMSLQTNDPSLDCNTATGTDCGTIQLKAEAVPSGDPIAYIDLGAAHDMTYGTITNGGNYPSEQIIIDATDFESYNAVKHNAQFSDGLSMTFKAVITDLAGNQLETEVYGTAIIVDQTAPASGTTGAVVTNADSDANIVSGYWNSHNTGLQITTTLPDDATLDGGAVHILGKVTGAASYNYLGIYNVNSGNYDAAYNISSAELTAQLSTVPSTTTFLADSVENWSGIEEISDFADGAELTFAARVFDVAGNYTDWSPSATTITVDETVPTVTEVTSLNTDRAYTVDDVVTLSVVASENITNVETGSDNSTLELAVGGGNGGANPTVPFRNASNDTIYYVHTVSAGESSEDASPLITSADNLNYAATNSLVINTNGGALIDPAGNNLNTLLPTTPGDSALAQKKSIIIDSDDFGVTFNYFETTTAVTDSSDSLVSVNDVTLIIRGTFTDSVQIDSIPTLAIDFPPAGASTGDIASAAMTRTGIWQYDYSLALIDSVDGNLTITPTAYDKAANIINQSSVVANGIIRMDNLEPEFTLLSPDSNSFVNNRQVSYQLSEDVRTGKITWTRVSGKADPNSPHEVDLVSAELLDDAAYDNITLANDPVNLVDGTYYNIAWSAVDSADNPSVVDKFVSSPVLFDTTGPSVQLTYSQYVAGGGYTDTITATFDERIWPAPQISLDYQGQFNDVSPAENMVIDAASGGDSTVWFYEAVLPGGEENNGTTYVAINALDLAGNLLLAANIFDGDTLIVDNSAPSCTLTYVNVNKPWLTNEGKGQDEIQVVARMSEKFDPFPFPQLNIEYSDSTNDSFVNLEGGVSSSGDSIFTWTITLPDSIKNSGNMTISLNAKDRAQNLIDRYFGETDFIVDNTPPDSFVTGTASSYGLNPKVDWINGITDSVGVLVPIPAISSDATIFYNPKGGLDFELWNKTRGVGWVNIPNAQEPFADSIQLGGQNLIFYRTMNEIEAIMAPEADLVQGDSIYIRAAISDRVGNKTYGDSSTTVFVYDPYPPTVSSINGGNVLTLDTLKSQDNITAAWTGSSDSTYISIPGSGILNYDYKIHMHDSLGVYMDTLIDWTSTGLVEEMNRDDLGLRHNRMYSVNIRAVDVAGNVSVSVISDTLYRLSSAPVITTIDSTIIWEDSLYTDTVQLTDLDLSTVLGDTFSYAISWENSLLPPSGDAIEIADTNGVIRWTPAATDTGKFQLKVLVIDMWGLKDSLVYPITIKPVNDRPVFSQLLPDTFFVEDQTDTFKINLTHYISDEDNNDTTEITWSAVIKDTTNRPGYPRTSLFFGPGSPEYMKDYLRQRYLPTQRNTVSKTEFFQGELKPTLPTMNKALSSKISIQFIQDNALRTFAYFTTDSNYYGADHNIKFIALDKKLFNNNVLHTGLIGEDSLLLTISPTNDRPQWSTIPIQSMYENDTMRFDPGAYVIDVDDTSLTFNLSATTNEEKMSIAPIEYSSHNLGDSVVFIPQKLWSDFAVIQVIAKDAFNARDTAQFTIDVIRVPRPHIAINVVQNNIFTNYYDILVTDTISKARNLTLEVQNESVVLDTIGRHTFRGHHKFFSPGTYSIEVFADALVGDTTVFRSVGLVLARSSGRWSGASSDGRFHVDGEAGAVSMDQSIMVVDSTMFNKGLVGSYKLGDDVQEFVNPVKVSLMNYQEDQAVYQRNHDNTWTELPSYYDQGRIVAYTGKMGYFRLGRKTLVVPGLTSLGQNYPNPFNPVTKITYDVGFVDGPEQHVNLSIYNLLGQHVQTLVDGQQTIGRHTVPWYGRDKTGMNVASGVYFMHMTTNTGKIQTKKVMLLR